MTVRGWLLRYVGVCLAILAAALIAVWLLGGYVDLGLSEDGVIALIITIAVTAFLSIGLMGLVFYSGRSGADDKVIDPTGEVHRHRR